MQSNNKFGIERGQCSFYRNVKVKENVVATLSEFVTQIKKGKWRNEVTRYRQLKERGMPSEAARVKENLPAIVVAGCCEGAHTKANFRSFSGYAIVDVDHIDSDVRALLKRLEEQSWAYAGWVSVSGTGIKLVVQVMAETKEEYEGDAYPKVAACVSRLIGQPVDMQCKDLTRMCYVSWDENAFLKEDCDVFPWREMTENSRSADSSGSLEIVSASSQPQGMVARFFERFCHTHTFAPGSRHDFLLKLGASARRNGMNLEELSLLVGLAELNCIAPDYPTGEIRRNITDSYHFTENLREEERAWSGAKVREVHYAPFSAQEKPENEEEEIRERNREMRLKAPCFPDWIFDKLPAILSEGIRVAKNNRQRDMLLLSMLTNLSACLPNVRMIYDDTYVYPHLFLAVIASSASGKGIMAHASRLGKGIQKELETAHATKQRDYENELFVWEQERSRALKEKRSPDQKQRPEPVLRETLWVPADTSRSQLIQLLAGSPQGILLNTSEFDTLNSAVKADYGRFDDLMRACFHHEMFGTDFKTDKRAFIVHTPKMAFCGSGTPAQFYRLCPTVENGAYSRYLIYIAEQDTDFQLMAPRKDTENKVCLFNKLSDKVLEMYRFLKSSPTEVLFTTDQWVLHKSFFQSALQGVRMEETEGPVSVVFRCGLSAARLSMIFTAMRKFEALWSFRDVACTDNDFQLALAIMEVLMYHSLMFATSLQQLKSSPSEMRNYFQVRKALEKLKSEFSYSELIAALNSEGISTTSAKRCRKRLLELGVIVKQADSYRFANREWRGRLEKATVKREHSGPTGPLDPDRS